MNPFERLDFYKSNYTNSELTIYKWIKDNPSTVIRNSIDQLAHDIPTSKAAIIRFSKKLGYTGFAEFKFELSRFIISGTREKNKNQYLDTAKSITSLYSGFIKQINDYIDPQTVKKIAEIMSTARRVKIVGRNRTGFSALQLRYRLTKIDFDAEAITDSILLYQIEESLNEQDVAIIFTTAALDTTYLKFIQNVSKNNVKTIMVSCAQTPLLKEATYSVLLPSISKASNSSFLDDQAIIFVFIEILLAEIAYIIEK